MELLRAHEIVDEGTLVFRYSRRRAIIGSIVAIAAAVSLGVVGLVRHAPIAIYLAAVVVTGLLLSRRAIRARFRTSNWLVVVGRRGLFIQLRSYLNYHFPASDRTVAFIPYDEIGAAWSVREERELPDVDSRGSQNTTVHRRRLVAIELRADSTTLADALRDERTRPTPRERTWYGSSGVKYQHYPVALPVPTRLEIEWRVTPSADALLDVLREHTVVKDPEVRSVDSSRRERLGRREQEEELLALAMAGQTMAAVKVARKLYGFDLTEAKQFVEGLRSDGARTSRRAS